MREHNNQTELTEDDVYALMMDALDGELTAEAQHTLQTQLEAHPELNDAWRMMQTIDGLFTQAPIMAPSADFAVQTIARLPNLRARRWLSAAIYAIVLVSGFLPFAILGWYLGTSTPVAVGPAFVDSAVEMYSDIMQIVNVLFSAIEQLLLSFGDVAGEQPAVVGSLMVMIGSIVLWSGVYQQFTRPTHAA